MKLKKKAIARFGPRLLWALEEPVAMDLPLQAGWKEQLHFQGCPPCDDIAGMIVIGQCGGSGALHVPHNPRFRHSARRVPFSNPDQRAGSRCFDPMIRHVCLKSDFNDFPDERLVCSDEAGVNMANSRLRYSSSLYRKQKTHREVHYWS